MPKFFFNVRDRRDFEDHEGIWLPDFKSARLEGIRLSGAVVEDEAAQLDDGEDWRLEVTDDTGLILFAMTFLITQSPAISSPLISGYPPE